MTERPVQWLGSSLKDLKEFPDLVMRDMGFQLSLIQQGLDADDAKPIRSIGSGAYEIRVKDDGNNQFRTVYVAKFGTALFVLHAFSKKTRTTTKHDIDVAKSRYKDMMRLVNNAS
jgi:phage-related protein